MAPAVAESLPQPPLKLLSVSRDIFPDGIKTSGQHPPLYEKLKSFEEFPDEIKGSSVWKKEDYENNPERWVHRFSDEEVAEMSTAADAFIAAGTPLTGIAKVSLRCSSRTCRTHGLGQLPSARYGRFSFCRSHRAAERQGLHSVQGFPS